MREEHDLQLKNLHIERFDKLYLLIYPLALNISVGLNTSSENHISDQPHTSIY